MLRPRAGRSGVLVERRESIAIAITVACFVAAAVMIALSRPDTVSSLSVILGIAALIAGLLVAGERDGLSISASFIVIVLAAAFPGPRSAAAAAVLAELTASARLRTRWQAIVLNNLPAAVLSPVAAAVVIRSISPHPTDSVTFYVAVVAG